ncbi:hypothetical protein [Halalkalicoccus jeotgali]|uniref:Uncharacterized protein n=1 Tax=Halalkalicoccus jeotgali (strain DSM 18796 / CECT 7217 / JCM 14584 / KCTC 4019 / B3) TaxID=795797 RepID=D8J3C5_HALJB|nr:hypothetical protein [Halalkalicoccus jeotgali]ADJ15232.1 hypothetical protein HacjB3_09245 [Halalkalicoccus jeotgali B3]ELY35191.1 hypothetical protein C497_13433 [Halalkalicoccus jeotgali B3]
MTLPTSGRILLTGPSNVGKTRQTARALAAWVEEHGAEGVAILEFAPQLEREGVLLGGRLDRFIHLPERAWTGILDARAPRAEGDTEAKALALARANAREGIQLIESMPPSRAVFVNDATIPFQHAGDVEALLVACEGAEFVVMNAFAGEELGTDDLISRREREARRRLADWADTHEELR